MTVVEGDRAAGGADSGRPPVKVAGVDAAGVVRNLLVGTDGGLAVSSGANVVEGATADAAVITDTTGTMNGKLRGLVKWAFERMPASLGRKAEAGSLAVVQAAPILSVITVAVPGAGAEWTYTIPASHTYRIHLIAFTFATSATVATRGFRLNLTDAAANRLLTVPSSTQVASLTNFYTGEAGASPVTVAPNLGFSMPAPGLLAAAGWVLSSSTVNIQVGDQYSAIFLVVEDMT